MSRSTIIVTEARLRAVRSRFRFETGTRYFSVHRNVQTGSGAHPNSYSVGAGVLSRGKVAGRDVSHSRLSRAVRNEWCSTFIFPVVLFGRDKLNFTFTSVVHLTTFSILNSLRAILYLSDLKTRLVPHSKLSASVIKTYQLTRYREKITVCSEIHAKHINPL